MNEHEIQMVRHLCVNIDNLLFIYSFIYNLLIYFSYLPDDKKYFPCVAMQEGKNKNPSTSNLHFYNIEGKITDC